jgi:hypothetical protein
MKIRAIIPVTIPLVIAVAGLVATTGCHHVHHDVHRARRGHHHRDHDKNRDRHHHDRRHDDGRHRGWYKH